MSSQVYRTFTPEATTAEPTIITVFSQPHDDDLAPRMGGMWTRVEGSIEERESGSVSVRELDLRDVSVDEGDHERFSHYVQKEKILESAISGQPVIALCGKVWTPGRDPEKFPVCPTCKEIYESLRDD